jgi:long-subunit fatty acid transport protein
VNKTIVAVLSSVAASAAWAGPYAPQEFDFSELDRPAYGIVESVREVQLGSEFPAGFADVFEHAVKPKSADQLLIRLDDGRALRVMENQMQRLEAGQRVRIESDTSGTRVERE